MYNVGQINPLARDIHYMIHDLDNQQNVEPNLANNTFGLWQKFQQVVNLNLHEKIGMLLKMGLNKSLSEIVSIHVFDNFHFDTFVKLMSLANIGDYSHADSLFENEEMLGQYISYATYTTLIRLHQRWEEIMDSIPSEPTLHPKLSK